MRIKYLPISKFSTKLFAMHITIKEIGFYAVLALLWPIAKVLDIMHSIVTSRPRMHATMLDQAELYEALRKK